MTGLILPRRQFLKAAVGIIASPAVVRLESLMRLSAPRRSLMIVPDNWLYVVRLYNIAGIQQEIAKTWIYGNPEFPPKAFEGFATLPLPRRHRA